MRFPDFLIIGAMKAGTTTLYFDLLQNERVFMPDNKEPHSLVDDEVLSDAGRSAYAAYFRGARDSQICGEGSTGYTKIPLHEGVPHRASRICGSDLRLVYIMRDPIDRLISHHYHAHTYGQAGPSIDEAIRSDPHYLAFSQYARQLRAWLDVFDRDNLLLIRFDHYMEARQQGVQQISDFLGVGSTQGAVDEQKAYNKGDRRPVHRGVLSVVYHSPVYRRALRRFVPRAFRLWAFESFFPRGPERPKPPSDESVRWLVEQLAPDLEELAAIAGGQIPVWTPDDLLSKHLATPSPGVEEAEAGARS